MRTLSILAVLALAATSSSLVACGGLLSNSDARPAGTPESGDDDDDSLPSTVSTTGRPPVFQAACPTKPPANLAAVAADVDGSTPVLGPCGRLLYRTARGAVVLRDTDGTEITLAKRGSMGAGRERSPFDVTGEYVSVVDEQEKTAVLYEIATGKRFAKRGVIGFALDERKGKAIPYALAADVEVFGNGEWKAIEGSGTFIDFDSFHVTAPYGSVFVGERVDGNLTAVDLVRGKVQDLGVSLFEEGANNLYVVSNDGRVVMFQHRVLAFRGDSAELDVEKSGPVRFLSTEDGSELASFKGDLSRVQGSSFMEATRGHAFAFTLDQGAWMVDTATRKVTTAPGYPKDFIEDGRLIVTDGSGASLVNPATGDAASLATANQFAGIAVSKSGKAFVWAERTGCVRDSEGSGSCVGDIIALHRNNEAAPFAHAFNNLYGGLVWDDGSAAIDIALWKGAPPAEAALDALPLESSRGGWLFGPPARIDLSGDPAPGTSAGVPVDLGGTSLLVAQSSATESSTTFRVVDRGTGQWRTALTGVAGNVSVSADTKSGTALAVAKLGSTTKIYHGKP